MNETTILLVEDDHGLRTFLADNLTADGFDVLLADTVRDAVRLLEYKQPDLAPGRRRRTGCRDTRGTSRRR